MLALGALCGIGPLTVDTYLPALPALRADFGVTDVQALATLTGLLVGLGLGQLIIGPLSDAVGRRADPQLFGLAFSANAVGLVLATQLNPLLLRRYRPAQILSAAVAIALAGGLVLLITAVTGLGGLAAPLVGALDNGTAVPLALVIVAAAGLAGVLLVLARKQLRTV